MRKKASSVNERVFNQGPDKLRAPERIARLELERVVQLSLQDLNIKSLLDVGTGSGLFAEAFDMAGVAVSGVDINAEMIEAAKRHLPESKFFVAPAEDLPFPDRSFDATFFGVVFHEVSDYAKALREAHRVTRSRTFILEWQYAQEEFGPPLAHRLTEEFIRELSVSAGYRSFETIPLATLVMYKLVK